MTTPTVNGSRSRDERARGVLEIITAILLGLVSVATAIGAYQATQWSAQAGDLASASQQLRDRNLALFLQSQNESRDDGERMFDALGLLSEMTFYPEREEALQAEQDLVLASASPQLAAAWQAWEDSGYSEDFVPLYSPSYEAASYAPTASHNLISALADDSAKALEERGYTMTIVAVIFAVALLLLGVAGASSRLLVSATMTGGGAVAFLAGVAVVIFGVF